MRRGSFPLVVEEFEVFTDGPHRRDRPPHRTKSESTTRAPLRAVTLSVPSGSSLPFGRAALDILVNSCDFGDASLDMEITLSGERLDGSMFQTSWLGRTTVTNTCP